MPAQIFGAQAAAVQLHAALFGLAPSNAILQSYTSQIGSTSAFAFAATLGAQFAGTSDSALATQVLGNVGITASTLGAASYTALQSAVAQAFAAYPAQRGIVVLNAMNLLTGLESDITFGGIATRFNAAVTAAYTYASNTANTQTQPLVGITTTAPLSVNGGDLVTGTSGNDQVDASLFFNATSGSFLQTLNTGDSVDGGAGTDTLLAGFNNAVAQTITPTLTSIENLVVNATGTAGTTLDLAGATGLATVTLNNGRGPGELTIANLRSLLSTITLSNDQAGLTVNSAAATVAGTADTVALALSQVGGSTVTAPVVALPGYEVLNLTSSGPAANAITVGGYAAGTLVNVAGTTSATVSTGTGTNAITISGTGLTGSAALTVDASGAASDVRISGSPNGDTAAFGANYTSADSFDGGTGIDTLSMSSAGAAGVSATQANLLNLEVLSFIDGVTNAAYSPNAFGGATTLTLNAASAAGTSFSVNFGAGTSNLNLLANNPSNAGVGSFTVNAAGSAITDVLNLALGNAGTSGVSESAFTSNGFETVNISSNGLPISTNVVTSISLAATAATEVVVISGARGLTTNSITADRIDASALGGNLVIADGMASAAFASGTPVTTAGVQLTAGAGNDTLWGSNGADVIDAGAGNDMVMVRDRTSSAAAGANQGDILTGGAGADQFRFVAATLVDMLQQSAGTAQVVKITDFVAGTDKIGLVNTGGAFTGLGLSAPQTVASASTLAAIYAGITPISASTVGGGASGVVVTVGSGTLAGTYLYINDATAGVSSTNDLLVNISGISGTLTSADFVFT